MGPHQGIIRFIVTKLRPSLTAVRDWRYDCPSRTFGPHRGHGHIAPLLPKTA